MPRKQLIPTRATCLLLFATATAAAHGAITPAADVTLSTYAYVGNSGTGSLAISGGSTLSSDNAIIGNLAGSQGSVTVTGTGSTWSILNVFEVGNFGTGSLAIAQG